MPSLDKSAVIFAFARWCFTSANMFDMLPAAALIAPEQCWHDTSILHWSFSAVVFHRETEPFPNGDLNANEGLKVPAFQRTT